MHAQTDYETDCTLAVFASPQAAAGAVQALDRSGIHYDSFSQSTLAPGHYQVEDASMAEEASGALRGLEIGAPVGAAVGFGVAASVAGGSPDIMVGLAGAGAFAGALLGSFEGAVMRTRFDDDVATWIAVPEGSGHTLLTLHTSSADGTTQRTRPALRRAGAIAFLDPTIFDRDDH